MTFSKCRKHVLIILVDLSIVSFSSAEVLNEYMLQPSTSEIKLELLSGTTDVTQELLLFC